MALRKYEENHYIMDSETGGQRKIVIPATTQ